MRFRFGIFASSTTSEQAFYRWRDKYGGMEVADARHLKELESENAKLKRLVGEQMLVIDGLKAFGRKNDDPVGTAFGVGAPDLPGPLAAQGLPVSGAASPSDELHVEAT